MRRYLSVPNGKSGKSRSPFTDTDSGALSSSGGDALARFRGDSAAKSVPTHPAELALIIAASVLVCFLSWAIGGMLIWSQQVAGGLGLIVLGIALWPRLITEEYGVATPFRQQFWPQLLRFIPFWCGLAFFAYGIVQALNPAWSMFIYESGAWQMIPKEHITWLPSGSETPFLKMNAWRQMLIWAAPFCLFCALCIGLTRKRSILTLLTVIVANGTLLSLLALAQRLIGAKKMLWMWKMPAPYFLSTFVYKNHAGAYFLLLTVAALILMLIWHQRAKRSFARSSPAPLFGLLAALAAAATLLSWSRAASLLLAGLMVVCLIGFVVRLAFYRDQTRNPLLVGLLCVLFAGVAAGGVYALKLDRTIDKISLLLDESGGNYRQSVLARQVARQAGVDMLSERPLIGYGAGNFRFLFPGYQRQYPEITTVPWSRKKTRFFFWEFAHNDHLQFVIEMGVIGTGLWLLAFFSGVWQALRAGAARNLVTLLFALGLCLTLAHAWVDFPFGNPAILTLWYALAALGLTWARLSRTSA